MNLRTLLISLGLAVATAACGGAQAQAPTTQRPAPSGRPSGIVIPTPGSPATPATPPAHAYDRKGRRDPFLPVEIEQPDTRPYAVASAKLKGIVRGTPPRALLETADGIGYILKLGDILADGRLVEIGRDNVVFRVEPRRGSTNDRVVLRLPED